jgi:hypothetical protein
MILAMPNEGARSLKGGTCPNCSAELTDPYSAGCGQRQPGLDQPLRELAGEVMDAFLSFDARLTRTLTPLTTRPGFLPVEIPVGRQVRGHGRLMTAETCSGR